MCLCATPWTQEVGRVYIRRSKTTSGRLVCFQLTFSVLGCKILKKYLIASAIQTLIMNLLKHRRWRSFAKIVNSFHPVTIFAKSSILNVWLGSEYASIIYIHIFSLFVDSSETRAAFYVWVCSLLISTLYTLLWDLKMDWGLLSKDAGENTFLREQIVYDYKVKGKCKVWFVYKYR